jgi:hypothetical protein
LRDGLAPEASCTSLTVTSHPPRSVFTADVDTFHYGASGGNYFANLRVATTPVREPETCAMLLTGLGLMAFIARRRTRALAH